MAIGATWRITEPATWADGPPERHRVTIRSRFVRYAGPE
jgi:hypothetical protein